MLQLSFGADVIRPMVEEIALELANEVQANMQGANEKRVLLTKREAAKALGVSEATVDRLRKKGLPCVKMEGAVLFRPEALREWAAHNETKGGK